MAAMNMPMSLPSWQPLVAQWHPRTWRSLWRPVPVLVLPSLSADAQADVLTGAKSGADGIDASVPAYDAALLAWRDWCQTHRGQRCQVGLSSAWLMTGVVSQADAANANAAMAVMAQRWAHYMNLGAETLSRDWLVRATKAPGGWLVCATLRTLVDDLRAVAQSHGVTIAWMGPWWTSSLQRWVQALPKRKAAIDSASSALHLADAGWCLHAQANAQGLQQLWTEPAHTKDAADTLQAKPALVPAPALSIKYTWHDDVNVSGTRQRSAWWAWLVLALGAVALMWSVDHVDALRVQQDEASAQYQRLSRADRQMRMNRAIAMGPRHAPARASKEPDSLNTASTAIETPALKTAAAQSNALRMAQALAYPWPQHLNLLDTQAAAAQVVITQLSVSLEGAGSAGATVPWRVQAATRSDDDALRLAAHLPQGVLQSRAPLAQPFSTVVGHYTLQTTLAFTPRWQGVQP
jgi:hypothetical protein